MNRQLRIGRQAKSGRESTKQDCSELGFLKSRDLQCENVYSPGKARDADYPNCQFILKTKVRKETRKKVFPSPAGVCSLSGEPRVDYSNPRLQSIETPDNNNTHRDQVSPLHAVPIVSAEACWRKWTKYPT